MSPLVEAAVVISPRRRKRSRRAVSRSGALIAAATVMLSTGTIAASAAPVDTATASTVTSPVRPEPGSLTDHLRTTSTKFAFKSEPEHAVGYGESRVFRPGPDVELEIYGDNTALEMRVYGNGEDYWVRLRPGTGDVLRPGVFRQALQGSGSSRNPTIWFTGNGSGCGGGSHGRFAIDQIEFDESGAIVMADASFRHRCGAGRGPLATGTIHLARQPLTYRYTSDEGDFVGGGESMRFRNSSSVIVGSGDGAYFEFDVRNEDDAYDVTIEPPSGQEFEIGRTYPTERFADETHAALDANAQSRGCNASFGELTIEALDYAADGSVARTRFTFEQHCEGDEAAMRGTVHYFA